MEVLQADESVESGRDCSCTAPHRTWPQGNDRRQDFSSSRRSELTTHQQQRRAAGFGPRRSVRAGSGKRTRRLPRTTARSSGGSDVSGSKDCGPTGSAGGSGVLIGVGVIARFVACGEPAVGHGPTALKMCLHPSQSPGIGFKPLSCSGVICARLVVSAGMLRHCLYSAIQSDWLHPSAFHPSGTFPGKFVPPAVGVADGDCAPSCYHQRAHADRNWRVPPFRQRQRLNT